MDVGADFLDFFKFLAVFGGQDIEQGAFIFGDFRMKAGRDGLRAGMESADP